MKRFAYAVWCNYPRLADQNDTHSVFIFEGEDLLSVYRLPWISVLRLTNDLDKIGFKNISPQSAEELIFRQEQASALSASQQQILQLAMETAKRNFERAEWNVAHLTSGDFGQEHFNEILKEMEAADAIYTIVQAFAALKSMNKV